MTNFYQCISQSKRPISSLYIKLTEQDDHKDLLVDISNVSRSGNTDLEGELSNEEDKFDRINFINHSYDWQMNSDHYKFKFL